MYTSLFFSKAVLKNGWRAIICKNQNKWPRKNGD